MNITTGSRRVVCNLARQKPAKSEKPDASEKSNKGGAESDVGTDDPRTMAQRKVDEALQEQEQIEQEVEREQTKKQAIQATQEADKRTRAAQKLPPLSPAARKLHENAAVAHQDAASLHKQLGNAKMGMSVEQRSKAAKMCEYHTAAAKMHKTLSGVGGVLNNNTSARRMMNSLVLLNMRASTLNAKNKAPFHDQAKIAASGSGSDDIDMVDGLKPADHRKQADFHDKMADQMEDSEGHEWYGGRRQKGSDLHRAAAQGHRDQAEKEEEEGTGDHEAQLKSAKIAGKKIKHVSEEARPMAKNQLHTGSKRIVVNTWSDAAREAASQASAGHPGGPMLHGRTAGQHLEEAQGHLEMAAHRREQGESEEDDDQPGIEKVAKEHEKFAAYHTAAAAHLQGNGPAPRQPKAHQMLVQGYIDGRSGHE